MKKNRYAKHTAVCLSLTFAMASTLPVSTAFAADMEETGANSEITETGAGETGAGETGAGETGTGEEGTGETGAGETGAGETGTGETGAGEEGTGEAGAGETGTGETGAGETGTGETGAGEEGTGEAGAGETGTGEEGAGEEGVGEEGEGEQEEGKLMMVRTMMAEPLTEYPIVENANINQDYIDTIGFTDDGSTPTFRLSGGELSAVSSVVFDGVEATLVLDAFQSDSFTISLQNEASVTIQLVGESSYTAPSGCAGILVDATSTLVIDSDANGYLSVTGGNNSAAIGGNTDSAVGTIMIEGGNITANGGANAAGIGSGYDTGGDISTENGTITIIDGTVTATGGDGGAGIGTGSSRNGDDVYAPGASFNDGNITIEGGNVSAIGGSGAAGIGGGNHKDGGTITITGGNVTAKAPTKSGAGIGSGLGSSKGKMTDKNGKFHKINGGNITISGGSVTASSPYDGAGIGGGLYGDSGIILIEGSADVTANGGHRGAGIGGGYQGDANEITITGNPTVYAFGKTGKESKDLKTGGAGIGGGTAGKVSEGIYAGGSAGIIVIEGGDILAAGGFGAAGIGSGSAARDKVENSHEGNVSIIGGKIRAYSDGTKWAIDLVHADASADNLILQGRFRSNDIEKDLDYTDKESLVTDDIILELGNQTPADFPVMNGSNKVTILDGATEVMNFQMPYNYRSFATTDVESDVYYDIRLTSDTYGTAKIVSGVLVEGDRLPSSADAETDVAMRTSLYPVNHGLVSHDDLAFALTAELPPVVVPPTPEEPPTGEPPAPSIPSGPTAPVIIEDDEVPLAELPEWEEMELTEEPMIEMVEIGEEEVPLAEAPVSDVPQTGDEAAPITFGLTGLLALLGLAKLRKKAH